MSSDWFDDFFNNLATDLAPLIALFGESPTKQYLSECVSPIDIFIFSLAPLGIITTLVSAIRVGGSPSLRAFIGRAQEGGGNIEAELCSSTSRDVCEMYNNGGIARVFGRPKILEVVRDPHTDIRHYYGKAGGEPSCGIYSFRDYIESVNGRKEWTELSSRKSAETDSESPSTRLDTTNFAPHPNLSLNVGIKKRSFAWFLLAAASGVLLQSGVLIFASLSVFTFSSKFEKDGKPVDGYAFPFTLAGTIFLCFGTGMCGHIVERSTTERIFKRTEPPPGKRKSSPSDNQARSRLHWIQPGNQVMGDQVFDPFAYNETSGAVLLEYTTSWRDLQNKDLQKTNSRLVWIFAPLTLFGFVLQFIGLRALHSTISIAQLGATLLMSIIRSMLRTERLQTNDNRLGNDPDLFQGYELDWLVLEFDRDDLRKQLHVGGTHSKAQPSFDNSTTFIWQVATWPNCQGHDRDPQQPHVWYFSQTSGHITDPYQWLADIQSVKGGGIPRLGPRIFLSRARIARMTGAMPRSASSRSDSSQWEEELIPARKLAKTLANALERIMDVFCSPSTAPFMFEDDWTAANTIFVGLDCTITKLAPDDDAMYCYKNLLGDRVYITLTRSHTDSGVTDGQWNMDISETEAVLSLWMWSLKKRFRSSGTVGQVSGPLERTSYEQFPSTRLLYVCEAEPDGAVNPDIASRQKALHPWLGDLAAKVRTARLKYPGEPGFDPTWAWVLNPSGKQPAYSPMSLHQIQGRYTATWCDWLFGWDAFDGEKPSSHKDLKALIVRTNHSPTTMCAHEIFTKLFRNLARNLKSIGGETKVQKGRHGFFLANENLTEILKAFTDAGLGSENDARACVIPILFEQKKLPAVSILAQARDLGDEYRRAGAWEEAEEVLRWAWELSFQSWEVWSTTIATGASPENKDVAVDRNDPSQELWLCTVHLCECYRWALFCDGKASKYQKFGVDGIISMLERRKSLPDLGETLDIYGKVALRVVRDSYNKPHMQRLWHQLKHILAKEPERDEKAPTNQDTKQELPPEDVAQQSSYQGKEPDQYQGHDHGQGDDQSENRKESIISAIQRGDMCQTLYLLRDPSANQEDSNGRSSLSWAAEKGWYIVVKCLIEVGAVARQTDTSAKTPLHFAASSGNTLVLAHLLEQGLDVNCRDSKHCTPLFYAVRHGHVSTVKLLLTAKASVNSKDKEDRTPLLIAAENGQNAIVEHLLEEGADPNVVDRYGQTSLSLLTRTRNYEAVQSLLRRGAEPIGSDLARCSPLTIAVYYEHMPLVKLLLRAKADPNCRRSRNISLKTEKYDLPDKTIGTRTLSTAHASPLEIAVFAGATAITKELLHHGANPNIRLGDMLKNLDHGTKMLRLLWDKMLEPGYGLTENRLEFLQKAVEMGCSEIVKWTLAQPGVSVSPRDLCRTMERNQVDIYQIIMSSTALGLNVPVTSHHGWDVGDRPIHTPLTKAVSDGKEEFVKILLAHPDIEIDRKDGYERMAADYAKKKGRWDILELLDGERKRRQNAST